MSGIHEGKHIPREIKKLFKPSAYRRGATDDPGQNFIKSRMPIIQMFRFLQIHRHIRLPFIHHQSTLLNDRGFTF